MNNAQNFMKTLRTAFIIAGFCQLFTALLHAQDVDSAPPVVVKAVPEAGSKESVGKPRYEADQKTCVLKVKLEPNKTYGYWINSEKFHGFKDQQGRSAVPYLLVFKTKDQ